MNPDYENATADDKIRVLRTMPEYTDRMHPAHTKAVRLMAELCQNATPAAFEPDLPDSIDELLKTDAMKSRIHPDHQAAFKKFQKLHGL